MMFFATLGLLTSLYLTSLSIFANADDFKCGRADVSTCEGNRVCDCVTFQCEDCGDANCSVFLGAATCVPASDSTASTSSSSITSSSSTTTSSPESTTSSSTTTSTSTPSSCPPPWPEFTVEVNTYCAEQSKYTPIKYCGGDKIYDCRTKTEQQCEEGHTCKYNWYDDNGDGVCVKKRLEDCDPSFQSSVASSNPYSMTGYVYGTSTSDASTIMSTVTVTSMVSTSSTTSSSSSGGPSSSSSTDSSSSSSTDSSSNSSIDSTSSSSTDSSSSSSTDSSSSPSADSSSSTATSASSPSTTDTTFVTSTAPDTSSSSSSGRSSPAPTPAAKRSSESSIALSDLPEAEPTIPGWSTVSSPDTTTTAANGEETLIPADEVCALKKPWSATVCHENCVYDCVRRIRLADCAETGCGTFNIGARCYDGDTLRKSDAPHNLPLIEDQVALSQGQSSLSSTSSTQKALGSPTSSATATISGSTYWPQRLCDAKDHPDDPTLGLYQKYDTVESVCADQGSIFTCANKTETPCKKSRGGGSCCSTGGTALCCQVPGGLRLGFGNETWVKADGSVYATSAGNASEYGTLKEQGRESQYNPKNAGRMSSTVSGSRTASTLVTVTTRPHSSHATAPARRDITVHDGPSSAIRLPSIDACEWSPKIDRCRSLTASQILGPTAATASPSPIATRSGDDSVVAHIKQVGDEIVDIAKDVADNITDASHNPTMTRRDTFGYDQDDLKIRSPDNASVAHDNHGNAIGVYTSVTGTQGTAQSTCTPKLKSSIVARSRDNSVFERIKQIGNELVKMAKDAINGVKPTTSTEPEGLPIHMWNIPDDHPLNGKRQKA